MKSIKEIRLDDFDRLFGFSISEESRDALKKLSANELKELNAELEECLKYIKENQLTGNVWLVEDEFLSPGDPPEIFGAFTSIDLAKRFAIIYGKRHNRGVEVSGKIPLNPKIE